VIVIDSSALIAIAAREDELGRCTDAIDSATALCMSAATLTEVMVVAAGRNIAGEVETLIDDLAIEIVPHSAKLARNAWQAYTRWGRGFHKAKLNLGDVFSYALAKERHCPLLFVGNDFTMTDVTPA
jgi:ribonuclease VapC